MWNCVRHCGGQRSTKLGNFSWHYIASDIYTNNIITSFIDMLTSMRTHTPHTHEIAIFRMERMCYYFFNAHINSQNM